MTVLHVVFHSTRVSPLEVGFALIDRYLELTGRLIDDSCAYALGHHSKALASTDRFCDRCGRLHVEARLDDAALTTTGTES